MSPEWRLTGRQRGGIALRAAARVIDRRRVTPRSGWNPAVEAFRCLVLNGAGGAYTDGMWHLACSSSRTNILGARRPGQVHVRRAAVSFGLCYSLPGVRRQPSRCTAGREPSYSPLSSRAFVLHRAGRVRKAARGRLPCIATGAGLGRVFRSRRRRVETTDRVGVAVTGRGYTTHPSLLLSRPGGISPIHPCCCVAKSVAAWPNSLAMTFAHSEEAEFPL